MCLYTHVPMNAMGSDSHPPNPDRLLDAVTMNARWNREQETAAVICRCTQQLTSFRS